MLQSDQKDIAYGVTVLLAAIGLILFWPGLLQNAWVSSGFMPHGHCYLWKPGLVWLHILTDSSIGLSYLAISLTLGYLVYKTRKEIPFHWMLLSFGVFILACGATHFMEIWTLWHPIYWLSGGLKLVTAVASVTTAYVLPPLVPKVRSLLEAAKTSEDRRIQLESANQELALLYNKLKDLDQTKTQFFANVSHELRTPLALILGPTEALLQTPDLLPTERQNLEIIERNAQLLFKHVNDLLNVAKLDAGAMQLNYAEVDLSQLLRLITANFEGLAQAQDIQFNVTTPATLVAQVDTDKLQQICLNLLSNAFKFTPPGGAIACTLAPTADATSVVLTVQDTGPGVPLAMREMIFERFRQAEEGDTRRFGGTGLGLAIARDFAKLHHGSIEVQDAPNGGAQFIVQFPRMPLQDSPLPHIKMESSDLIPEALTALPGASELTATSAIAPLERDRPLVLVVEDNPDMNQFITMALSTDYQVVSASHGQEGLEHAIALRPDLILSDMMMPQMSGEQMVQALRTHPDLANIPIIILTARTDDPLRVRLLQEGAQDYLTKPFLVEELRARVHNLLTLKQTRDVLQEELVSQNQNVVELAQELASRKQELQLALTERDHLLIQEQQAREAAEQATRLKDEFLAVVSHELRTPLNAILGWSQTLQSRKLDESTTQKALATIERNAKAQKLLIEDLLDVSQIIQGKFRLTPTAVSLVPPIHAVIEALYPAAVAKQITLKADLDPDAGVVLGDARRLQQILWNLLSNSIKFTPEGGQVTIQLAKVSNPDSSGLIPNPQPPTPNLQPPTPNPHIPTHLQITVTDTGQGIASDFLPYVFDRFRQADSSMTRTHGGLGLGLGITRHLVELHGGTIQATSPGEGQGTTFTIQLPCIATSLPSPSHSTPHNALAWLSDSLT